MESRGLFSFPNPVNEVSARLVAAGVVVMGLATLVFDQPWIIAIMAYGFVARVLTGPTLSPLGLLVTRVLTPRLPFAPKLVPGPPKRFAQGIGAVVTVTAALLALAFDQRPAAYGLVGLIVVFAALEAAFAFCLGCRIFALLMRAGVIPARVCAECEDIWSRVPQRRTRPDAADDEGGQRRRGAEAAR